MTNDHLNTRVVLLDNVLILILIPALAIIV